MDSKYVTKFIKASPKFFKNTNSFLSNLLFFFSLYLSSLSSNLICYVYMKIVSSINCIALLGLIYKFNKKKLPTFKIKNWIDVIDFCTHECYIYVNGMTYLLTYFWCLLYIPVGKFELFFSFTYLMIIDQKF